MRPLDAKIWATTWILVWRIRINTLVIFFVHGHAIVELVKLLVSWKFAIPIVIIGILLDVIDNKTRPGVWSFLCCIAEVNDTRFFVAVETQFSFASFVATTVTVIHGILDANTLPYVLEITYHGLCCNFEEKSHPSPQWLGW